MGRPVRRRPLAGAGGPVTLHPLRLAAGALRPRRLRSPRNALHRAGLLTDDAHRTLLEGLAALRDEYDAGSLHPGPSDEDVHGALERLLIERVGADAGGRLRAGRSRNDQVATLFKAYLRDRRARSPRVVLDLVDVLAARARDHLDVVMPGPHPPAARAAGAALPPPAGPRLAAAARRGPAARLGCARRRRLAVRLRGAGRLEPRPGPAGRGPRARLRGVQRELDRRHGGPRLRGRVRLRRGDDRGRPEPDRRGGRDLDDGRVRVRPRSTTATPRGRASCRRRRTPTSPS